MRNTTFGPVTVTAINKPNNGSTTTVNVTLEQIQTDTYTPDNVPNDGTPKNLQLATFLGSYSKNLEPRVYTSTRRITQNVPVGSVTIGQFFDNLHIQRVKWTEPQWEGHQPAADESFYTTNLVEGEKPDIIGVKKDEPVVESFVEEEEMVAE